jgi:hypothetical protein
MFFSYLHAIYIKALYFQCFYYQQYFTLIFQNVASPNILEAIRYIYFRYIM